MADVKLPKAVKIYVVQQLAMWESPSIIQRDLKENFAIEVSLPAILNYDPTTVNGTKKWKDLFDQTRADFIKDTSSIPIANKAFRLRELNNLYRKQKLNPLQNPVEMRAALEQAAKESGNQFTNRTEHTGKGGSSLIPESAQVVVYIPDNGRGDAGSGVTADLPDDTKL